MKSQKKCRKETYHVEFSEYERECQRERRRKEREREERKRQDREFNRRFQHHGCLNDFDEKDEDVEESWDEHLL